MNIKNSIVTLLVVFATVLSLPGLASAQSSNVRTVSEIQEEKDATAQDIVSVLNEKEEYSFFVMALKHTGLGDALAEGGPYTVLAPTNEAFARLGDTKVEDYNFDELVTILRQHLIVDEVTSEQARKYQAVMTANGDILDVQSMDESLTVGNATVTEGDIRVANGVIHGIDTVLLPPQEASHPTSDTETEATELSDAAVQEDTTAAPDSSDNINH